MDSNIDPSITEQDLFHVQASLEESNKPRSELGNDSQVDHIDLPNVFKLNEYVSDNHVDPNHVRIDNQQNEGDPSAAAALSMIQFGGFDGNNQLDYEAGSYNNGTDRNKVHTEVTADEANNENQEDGGRNGSLVKFVPYNPSTPSSRLGRPRKNIKTALAPPENSSSRNYKEALVSKFRFDRLPLDGPGSRGGRLGQRRTPRGRVTVGSLRNSTRQTVSTHFSGNDKLKSKSIGLGLAPSDRQTEVFEDRGNTFSEELPVSNDYESKFNVRDRQERNLDDESKGYPLPIPVHTERRSEDKEKTTSLENNDEDLLPSDKKKSSCLKKPSTLTSVSKTTILSAFPKNAEKHPCPSVGLNYDLYDENIMLAPQNREAASEKIAFGAPVVKSPYAQHIIYIISFLGKFWNIVYGRQRILFYPQDFEQGLSLPPISSDHNSHEDHNSRRTYADPNYNPSYVSHKMIDLFCRLTSLVLNREMIIDINSQVNTVFALRSLVSTLGLPGVWRDDSPIFESQEQTIIEDEIGDYTNPEEIPQSKIHYKGPVYSSNPFQNSIGFAKVGFQGIEKPLDRLLVLKTLVQWSLCTSASVRNSVDVSIQDQEITGETSCVSRIIHKGLGNKRHFQNYEARKRRSNYSLEDERLVDTPRTALAAFRGGSNSRLDQHCVGDLGFKVGRFYLCGATGAGPCRELSSNELQLSFNSFHFPHGPMLSNFKLYVEDVHLMLSHSLKRYGIEINDNGDYVENNEREDTYWYEVASNVDELTDFVRLLGCKVGKLTPSEPMRVISTTSLIYKPILHLYEYLSSVLAELSREDNFMVQTGV